MEQDDQAMVVDEFDPQDEKQDVAIISPQPMEEDPMDDKDIPMADNCRPRLTSILGTIQLMRCKSRG